MNNLEELYRTLNTLRKNNWAVPEELLSAIEKSENELIEQAVKTIEKSVSPLVASIQRPFKIILDHQLGTDLSVKVEIPEPIIPNNDDTPPTLPDVVTEDLSDETAQSTRITRRKSVGFKVTFPDGTIFHESQAVETFILALKKIGLERIATDALTPMHAGYRVVDKRERIADRQTQRPVDGYYIYTNIGNDTKIEDLHDISQRYGINLVITMDNEENEMIQRPVFQQPFTDDEVDTAPRPIVELFRQYLSQTITPNSVKAYISTLSGAISRYVQKIVDARAQSIFNFTTSEDLEICIDMLKASPEFMAANDHKHRSMTAALQQYLQFLKSL